MAFHANGLHCKCKYLDIRIPYHTYPKNPFDHLIVFNLHSLGNSADKLMTFFLIFSANRLWHFMQMVSSGDNLHECQIPFSWKISKCLLNFYPACYFYPPTLLHTYNLLKIKVPDTTTADDIFISFYVCFSEKIRLYISCESAARHIIQGWLGEAKVLCIISLGHPTDIGLQFGKACYPCSG